MRVRVAGLYRHPKSRMWWFRMVVPERYRHAAGKREWKYSLETSDESEARLRHAEKLAEIRRYMVGLDAQTATSIGDRADEIVARGMATLARSNIVHQASIGLNFDMERGLDNVAFPRSPCARRLASPSSARRDGTAYAKVTRGNSADGLLVYQRRLDRTPEEQAGVRLFDMHGIYNMANAAAVLDRAAARSGRKNPIVHIIIRAERGLSDPEWRIAMMPISARSRRASPIRSRAMPMRPRATNTDWSRSSINMSTSGT